MSSCLVDVNLCTITLAINEHYSFSWFHEYLGVAVRGLSLLCTEYNVIFIFFNITLTSQHKPKENIQSREYIIY